MKIAVCVSGTVKTDNPNGDLLKNNRRLIEKFPEADFYYATWDSYKDIFNKLFPNYKCSYFKEPEISYHPYFGINSKNYVSKHFPEFVKWVKKKPFRKEWTRHHTKQILIHSMLVKSLPKHYDIIVRTRFDVFIHRSANFNEYIKDTFDRKRVNSFATTKAKMFNTLYESDMTEGSRMKNWMLDQLIIHRGDMLNHEEISKLHENKLLHPAEFGWYQVLSKPFGDNHVNHHGWVNHDKNILDKFLKEVE